LSETKKGVIWSCRILQKGSRPNGERS